MKILVVMPVEEKHKELLISKAPDAEWHFMHSMDISDELAKSADIVIGNIAPYMINSSENLKWIQLNSAGTDGYTQEGAIPADAILTNATGAYGVAISEHMIGSLLYLMKKINMYSKDGEEHKWVDHGPVKSIYGSKTVVVGCGDIGKEFAKRMHACGSNVVGIKRKIEEVPDYIDRMVTMDKLLEEVKDADIVASCLPGTKDTYQIFNDEAFSCMKKGAYFLNVGRGNAVDSIALAQALNNNHLAGAAVDVTDPEPLPADHPLWEAKNLLITPHVSGGFHVQETHDRIIGIAAHNLECFANNKIDEFINIIDR